VRPDELNGTTPASSNIVDETQWIPIVLGVQSFNQLNRLQDQQAFIQTIGKAARATRQTAVSAVEYRLGFWEFGTAWTIRQNLTFKPTAQNTTEQLSGCGPEPWEEKMVFVTWRVTNRFIDDNSVIFWPNDDPTKLNFKTANGTNLTNLISRVHIAHHPQLRVNWYSSETTHGNLLNGETDTITIASVDDMEQTGIIHSISSNLTGAGYPQHHRDARLTSTSTVEFRVGFATADQNRFSLQVVQFPDIASGGGSDGDDVGHIAYGR